jgi:hypothetical protein
MDGNILNVRSFDRLNVIYFLLFWHLTLNLGHPFFLCSWLIVYWECWCSSNALDLCLGGHWFEFWARYLLPLLRILWQRGQIMNLLTIKFYTFSCYWVEVFSDTHSLCSSLKVTEIEFQVHMKLKGQLHIAESFLRS